MIAMMIAMMIMKYSVEEQLSSDISEFYANPLGFVLYAFPWGEGVLKDQQPKKWQVDFLTRLGDEVQKRAFDGVNAVEPIRMAVASGHGIGKSALTAWLLLWISSTRPHAKGIVTANTSDQLKTKTWSELAKWLNLSINKHWFEYSSGKGSMSFRHKLNPEGWRADAQTCREENSESFAGLHASNSTPYYLFDEGSAIPDKIYEVAYGGLTDGEPMFFVFGNPTRNSGRFREFWRKERHRWITWNIDARQVEGTNKSLFKEWADDYGEDSDFVKVRVRGEFPSQSIMQFFSDEIIDPAIGRELPLEKYKFAPIILGVDPAWTGSDEFVVYKRQGLYSKRLMVLEKNDNDFETAGMIAHLQDEHGADCVNIDAGYGTGIYSAGKNMGRQWNLIWFSGKSSDIGCLNKRAEMIKDVRDWLRQGGSIEKDKTILEELRSIETVGGRIDGKIQIESKEQIKKRIGISTNRLDALALTFATNVAITHGRAGVGGEYLSEASDDVVRGDFDPFQ